MCSGLHSIFLSINLLHALFPILYTCLVKETVSAKSKELHKLYIEVKDEKNPKIKHKWKLFEE